jgi:hypothetical protein
MYSVITSRSDNSVFKMLDTVCLQNMNLGFQMASQIRSGDRDGHSLRSTAFQSNVEGVAYSAIL